MTSNRIDTLFERCRAEKRAALILYLTAGFPSMDVTRRLLPVLQASGCDLLEFGIPFSDPIADGPVIQRASTIALQNGASFPAALDEISTFRKSSSMPVVLFGAYNPFLARGLSRSAQMAAAAGADGFLAADLPVEESSEFRSSCAEKNLHLIMLAAPTSPPDRIARIAAASSGFIYCIARRGITGVGKTEEHSVTEYLDSIRSATKLPLAVGFGISTPDHARAMAPHADAVVVGSGLINRMDECLKAGRDLESDIASYVKELAAAVRR